MYCGKVLSWLRYLLLRIGEGMVFSEDVVKNAFDKVNGYCQICGKKLIFNSRGNAEARGAWEARNIKPVSEGGKDEVRNCMILCHRTGDKEILMNGNEMHSILSSS